MSGKGLNQIVEILNFKNYLRALNSTLLLFCCCEMVYHPILPILSESNKGKIGLTYLLPIQFRQNFDTSILVLPHITPHPLELYSVQR